MGKASEGLEERGQNEWGRKQEEGLGGGGRAGGHAALLWAGQGVRRGRDPEHLLTEG